MDTTTMVRDEFEEWLDQNRDEILDGASQTPRSLMAWVASYMTRLKRVANDSSTGEEGTFDSAFGGADEDDLFGGGGDD